jgi:hypothetical protein
MLPTAPYPLIIVLLTLYSVDTDSSLKIVAFEIAKNSVLLRLIQGKNGMCGNNVEITTDSEICVCRRSFVSECRVTHTPSVVVGQIVTERNTSLLFSGELDQWYSTWGTRTPGGTRRHLKGYVKLKKTEIYYFMINTLINN